LVESFIIISTNLKLRKIITIINDVISVNINRRIVLNNNSKTIRDLVNSLNSVFEKMSKSDNELVVNSNMMKRMISNISHDFKTPLTSLIGYIELIQGSDGLDIAEIKEYLKVIYDKSLFLNNILDNFFYMARLDSNDEKLNIEKINISEAIREQFVLFYEYLKKMGKEPAIEIPEEDIYVVADKMSVNRIINNLLSNSLKYGSDGDTIGISLKDGKDYTYIEIWDNGKGISERDLPLIFERLFTAEDSRNAKLSGTGIGLSIVKQLVNKNKGTISVQSTPFKKTSFIFTLPKYNDFK
jgi:signal transduction histidine kinase